jgi:hypothetical protein
VARAKDINEGALLGRPVRVFVAATGAGAGIQHALWRTPGASTYLAGAVFPYAQNELCDFLGFTPERYASEETAVDMAMAAYARAFDPESDREPVGLGVTASVTSNRPHRGDLRVHASVMTRNQVIAITLILEKAGETVEAREADGFTADTMATALLYKAIFDPSDGPGNAMDLARARFFARPLFTAQGKRLPCSALREAPWGPLFPGTFNPPHAGHFGMAKAGMESLSRGGLPSPTFAICATPPHKPALRLSDMLERSALLAGHARVFTEGDPLFIDKARAFPGRAFLIGADALLTMLDPKWNPAVPIETMLAEFARLNTSFLVFGRRVGDRVITVEDVRQALPQVWHSLVIEGDGVWGESSSALRAAREAAREGT